MIFKNEKTRNNYMYHKAQEYNYMMERLIYAENDKVRQKIK